MSDIQFLPWNIRTFVVEFRILKDLDGRAGQMPKSIHLVVHEDRKDGAWPFEVLVGFEAKCLAISNPGTLIDSKLAGSILSLISIAILESSSWQA
jgi:hypothetical protein